MSFIHSGVVEAEPRRLIEQQLSADLAIWLADWVGDDAQANLAELRFHYSETLFQPPQIWSNIESKDFHQVESKKNQWCTVVVSDLNAYSNALLSLSVQPELNDKDLTLVQTLATESLSALTEMLNQFADNTASAATPVVVAELRINDSPFYFCLGTEYVQHFQQQVAQQKSIETQTTEQLLKSQEVDVDVSLTTQPLSFDALCQLQQGDVIPLQQMLADPIAIKIKGTKASSGYLVNKDNNKAIYLTGKNNEI